MVKAINFVVRNSAGGTVQGAVGGEGSNFIQVGSGEKISLNLARTSVLAYERQGSDLIIKLADGSQVVLSGYYEATPGHENSLYLSSDGEVSQVLLQDTGTNGVLYADYGPVDAWNKFSAVDDLRFANEDAFASMGAVSDDPAGMGFLVPGLLGAGGGLGVAGIGAAALGGAALISGGGGSGSGTDTTPGGGTDTVDGGGGTDTTPGGGGTDTTPGGGGTDTTPGGGGTDTTPGGGGTDTTPGGGGTDTTPGGGGTDTTPGGGGDGHTRADPTVRSRRNHDHDHQHGKPETGCHRNG